MEDLGSAFLLPIFLITFISLLNIIKRVFFEI